MSGFANDAGYGGNNAGQYQNKAGGYSAASGYNDFMNNMNKGSGLGTGELKSFGYQQQSNKGPIRATDLGIGNGMGDRGY